MSFTASYDLSRTLYKGDRAILNSKASMKKFGLIYNYPFTWIFMSWADRRKTRVPHPGFEKSFWSITHGIPLDTRLDKMTNSEKTWSIGARHLNSNRSAFGTNFIDRVLMHIIRHTYIFSLFSGSASCNLYSSRLCPSDVPLLESQFSRLRGDGLLGA